MPRGDKDKYTDKQKRKAEHIEESYEAKGVSRTKPSPAPGPRSTNSRAVGSARAAPARRKPSGQAKVP